MGVINTDELMSALKPKLVVKPVEGIGDVAFRPLSRAATWEFSKERDGFSDLEFSCWLISKVAVNEDGSPLIPDEAVATLAEQDSEKFDALFNVAFEVSGLAAETAKK